MFFDKLIERKVTLFEQELLQKYYAEVESMYGKMRGWRHDYRHHIQAMKVHAAKGELAEIQCYLDMLDDDLTNVETVIRTGNRAADAVRMIIAKGPDAAMNHYNGTKKSEKGAEKEKKAAGTAESSSGRDKGSEGEPGPASKPGSERVELLPERSAAGGAMSGDDEAALTTGA